MLHISFTLLNLIAQATYTNAVAQAVHLEAKYGIEAELTLAIIQVESGFKPGAVGASHGEIGLMQLRPKYFPNARHDVKTNMERGVRHLYAIRKGCVKKHGPAWFVCYNVGQNTKLKYPILHPYYKKVSAAYAKEKYVKKTAANLRATLRNASGQGPSIIAQTP